MVGLESGSEIQKLCKHLYY